MAKRAAKAAVNGDFLEVEQALPNETVHALFELISEVKEQISSLKAEVETIKSGASPVPELQLVETQPQAVIEEPAMVEAQDDDDEIRAGLLEPLEPTLTLVENPEPVLEEAAGECWEPFDPEKFAKDFEDAVANPEEMEFDLFAGSELEQDEIDQEELESQLREMVEKNPEIADVVAQFNSQNSADFEWEDPLTDILKDKVEVPAFEVPLDVPLAEAVRPALSEDELDQLVREAAFADAVTSEPLQPSQPIFASEEQRYDWVEPGGQAPTREFEPVVTTHAAAAETYEPEAVETLPYALAASALAVPLRIENGALVCIVAKPYDEAAIARVEEEIGMPIQREPGQIEDVVNAIRSAYAEVRDKEAKLALLDGAEPAKTEGVLKKVKVWLLGA